MLFYLNNVHSSHTVSSVHIKQLPPFHTRIAETVVWVRLVYFLWNLLLETFETFMKLGFYYASIIGSAHD